MAKFASVALGITCVLAGEPQKAASYTTSTPHAETRTTPNAGRSTTAYTGGTTTANAEMRTTPNAERTTKAYTGVNWSTTANPERTTKAYTGVNWSTTANPERTTKAYTGVNWSTTANAERTTPGLAGEVAKTNVATQDDCSERPYKPLGPAAMTCAQTAMMIGGCSPISLGASACGYRCKTIYQGQELTYLCNDTCEACNPEVHSILV